MQYMGSARYLLCELARCLGVPDETDKYLVYLASKDPQLSALVRSCYTAQLATVRYLENVLEIPIDSRYKEVIE